MKKSAQKAVASVSLGSKRLCPKCGTKFYDFGKTDELECPKCLASIDLENPTPVVAEVPKKAPKAKDLNEEVLVEEEASSSGPESEFESLEDLEEDDEDDLDDIAVSDSNEDGEDF